MGLFGITINGYTLLIDPFRQNHKFLILLLLPLSSCMYVEGVDMNEKKPTLAALFETRCTMTG
jgi:hypothetical protein